MPRDALHAERGASTAVARMVAVRAARSAAVWGALFGLLVFNEAVSYRKGFPTPASRTRFAETFGHNAGLAAVTGPGRRLDTIQGFVAWRMFGLLITIGAVWGLLTATRLLRGEEDAGRWEMLLAGRTTRRHATVQALAGLGAGFAVLWTLTAAFTVAAGSRPAVGFSVTASLFYATAATASAAVFLAIGALTSQLSPTRRQANGVAAGVFGVSFLIRMIADGGTGLGWLRWASPLGWVENLHPLTGSDGWVLAPLVLVTGAAAGAAVVIAGRRDVGAAALTRRPRQTSNLRWLGGPAGLVARLERWVAVAWVLGLAVLALIFGIVARTAGTANLGDSAVQQTVSRLGGSGTGAAAWIGYEFIYLAALVAFAAASQISALRAEEADGHLDNLVARALGRDRWLAGRLGFGGAMVLAIGFAAGVGGWLGVAGGGTGIGLGDMLQAGLNIAAPALFVLGLGTLLYALVPRLAVPALYALILWSFVVQIIGSSITTNRWVVDSAVLSHLTPVPAAGLDVAAIVWLVGLGALAAAVGFVMFNRRDLVAA